MKINKSLTAVFIASALSLGVAQPAMAHEYTLSVQDAERYGISVPSIKVNYDILPYQHILYGFQLHVELQGATLNTTNVNTLRDATTLLRTMLSALTAQVQTPLAIAFPVNSTTAQ